MDKIKQNDVFVEGTWEYGGFYWKNILSLIVSLTLHAWDSSSDVIMAVSFFQNQDFFYSLISTAIIAASQTFAGLHAFHHESRSDKSTFQKWLFVLLGFFNLRILWEVWFLAYEHKGDLNKHKTKVLEQIKFHESMFEALPQILLQLYVLLRSVGLGTALNPVAIASICTSLVTVSLGLFRRFPSRVSALQLRNRAILFVFTLLGTVTRALFWVSLGLRLQGTVFWIALLLWACNFIVNVFLEALFPVNSLNQVHPRSLADYAPSPPEDSSSNLPPPQSQQENQNTSSAQSEQIKHLGSLFINAGLQVLYVNPFTMTKKLGSVNVACEGAIMFSHWIAQSAVGIGLISDTSESFGLSLSIQNVLGWLLASAAFGHLVLGVYQLKLLIMVRDCSKAEMRKLLEGESAVDGKLPGEADIEFVNSKGETFLMVAARKKFIKMVEDLIDREADSMAVDNGSNTALGKSTDSKCSTRILHYMLEKDKPLKLSQQGLLFPEIEKSQVARDNKIELMVDAISHLDPEFIKRNEPILRTALDGIPTCPIDNFRVLVGSSDVFQEFVKAFKTPELHVSGPSKSQYTITDEHAVTITRALTSPYCLISTLSLKDCILSVQVCTELAKALKSKSCQITVLILCNNNMQSSEASVLADALRLPDCKLKELTLDGNPISKAGATALAQALEESELCKLEKLSLIGCSITKPGVEQLVGALNSVHCKLTHIYLEGNATDILSSMSLSHQQKEILSRSAGVVRKQELLPAGGLHRNKMEADQEESGAKAQQQAESGVNLDPSSAHEQERQASQVGPQPSGEQAPPKQVVVQMEQLVKRLGKLVEQQQAVLSHTQLLQNASFSSSPRSIDGKGPLNIGELKGGSILSHSSSSHLSEGRQNRRSRMILTLPGVDAVQELSEKLLGPNNSPVNTVYLRDDKIGSDGAKVIAKALNEANNQLMSLKLEGSDIGPDGARAIAGALTSPNCKLQHLKICDDTIGDGSKAIIEAIKSPDCKLHGLSLAMNNMDEDVAKELKAMQGSSGLFWNRNV